MKCYTCDKPVKRSGKEKEAKRVFCNHQCYSVYKSEVWTHRNPNYSGGELKLTCKECGKSFTSKRYGKNRSPKFCKQTCYAEWRSKHIRGKSHPNFKGEEGGRITKPIRSQKKYERWMRAVLERDINKCVRCEEKENLHAHHIKHLSKMVEEYIQSHGALDPQDDVFYDLSNGQTLCVKCHRYVHKTKQGELLET